MTSLYVLSLKQKAKRVGCLAHLRRYFMNALEIQPDKKDCSTLEGQAVLKIHEIFKAEKLDPEKPSEKSEYSPEKIAEIRKNKSAELVVDFFEFCDKNQGITLPKSLTGRAISYALSQKKSLCTLLKNPQLELTNNAVERAVKPFVIGRKNWDSSLLCTTRLESHIVIIHYAL